MEAAQLEFPPDATWVAVFGIHGDEDHLAHASRIRDEAIRRGHPFVVSDGNYQRGVIPVVFVFADAVVRDVVQEKFRLPDNSLPAWPFVWCRQNVSGAGFCAAGGVDDMERLFGSILKLHEEALS